MEALQQALAAFALVLTSYAQTTSPPSAEMLISKWATTYNVSSEMMTKLMICESRGNATIINPDDVGSPSYGLFQYKRGTYDAWAEEIGETRDIMDVEAQIRLTAYALSKGRHSHWLNCMKQIGWR